jgi:sugar/nucleoside kinase (ribokinase family)
MSKILVVGSANADLMIAMPKLPKPGETVRGHDFLVAPGGKVQIKRRRQHVLAAMLVLSAALAMTILVKV